MILIPYMVFRASLIFFYLLEMEYRYQPPLPADQVKPLNDFEDNGGDRYVIVYVYEVTSMYNNFNILVCDVSSI